MFLIIPREPKRFLLHARHYVWYHQNVNVVVLIADIVNSRNIENRQQFQRQLKALLSSVNEHSSESLLSPLTLTIGDEFQAVYGNFDTLFPDIIEIITGIFPERLRVAIAYGPLSTDINPTVALEMDGRAFTEARELLERLKTNSNTMIQITTTELFNPELVDKCLKLFTNALEDWRTNTVRILNYMLRQLPVDEIADRLDITRRAVNKNIASHHLHDYVDLFRILAYELRHGLEIDFGEIRA